MSASNEQAIDSRVIFADGSEQFLSELWRDQPLILVFLRHLGWAFCRQQVAQLRQKLPQIEQTRASLVLVGMGTPEESAAFAEKAGFPFPVISDPGRRLYQAFGLKMASALDLFSPSVAFKALSVMAQGHGVGMPVGDIRQLPGVFIIDTGGRIVFSHIAKDPADHPDADTILAALSAMR